MTIVGKTLADLVAECDAPRVGAKFDSGKVKAAIVAEFADALMAVAKVGTFGANKYSRGNWVHVDNALERYTDAMWRHLLQEGNDPESGLPHFDHFVWNALAVMQLKSTAEKNHGKKA